MVILATIDAEKAKDALDDLKKLFLQSDTIRCLDPTCKFRLSQLIEHSGLWTLIAMRALLRLSPAHCVSRHIADQSV